jgi:DNA ligase 1
MDVDTGSSDNGKKRQVKEELSDSDDEPPVKRQRRKQSDDTAPTKKAKSTSTKGRQSAAQAATKKSKARGKAKVPKEEEEDTNAEEPEKPVERKQSPPSDDEKSAEAEPSAKDEDAMSEEEDEEVTAKAREKVQSALKSKHKDPYPDWKPGEPMPYAALCTTFSKIELTTKRLEILAHCSLFLRQVLRLTPKDLLPTVLLMINKLAADYAGIELGIGESLIMKAVAESTGRSLAIIKADQNEIGDLGLVAAKSRSNQPTMFKPKALTVRGVHEGLIAIATIEGQGAQGRKIAGIKKLLSAADAHLAGKGSKGVDIHTDKGGPSEAKYIVRTLEGKLRLGLAERTVLVALAQAMTFHEIMEKNNKIPSTDQLAKGEAILKSVYRYVGSLIWDLSLANQVQASFPVTKLSFQ